MHISRRKDISRRRAPRDNGQWLRSCRHRRRRRHISAKVPMAAAASRGDIPARLAAYGLLHRPFPSSPGGTRSARRGAGPPLFFPQRHAQPAWRRLLDAGPRQGRDGLLPKRTLDTPVTYSFLSCGSRRLWCRPRCVPQPPLFTTSHRNCVLNARTAKGPC